MTSKKHGPGGGVLVAIRNGISCIRIDNISHNVEQVFVKLVDYDIIISAIYIPPRSCNPDWFAHFGSHTDDIRNVHSVYKTSNFIFMGDYNLPNRDFEYDFRNIAVLNSTSVDVFVQTLSVLNFYQYNNIRNVNGNMLDLVFSDLNYINVGVAIEPLVKVDVDHPALDFSFMNCLPQAQPSEAVDQSYNFRRCDYKSVINNLHEVDWDSVLSEPDINKNATDFHSIILQLIEVFTPKRRLSKGTFPQWYSKRLIKLIIDKKKLHSDYKNSKTAQNYVSFSKFRAECKHLLRIDSAKYIASIESTAQINIKAFWKHVNSLTNSNKTPDVMHLGGVHSRDTKHTGSLFAQHFKSCYNYDQVDNVVANANVGVSGSAHLPLQISGIDISQNDVYMELSKLKCDKGAGPDIIPNLFLNKCKDALSYPLYLLFEKSLSLGIFPDAWKVSKLVPIYKKGDKTDIGNYRPISISNAIPKMF